LRYIDAVRVVRAYSKGHLELLDPICMKRLRTDAYGRRYIGVWRQPPPEED
jgi:hypothetical protein